MKEIVDRLMESHNRKDRLVDTAITHVADFLESKPYCSGCIVGGDGVTLHYSSTSGQNYSQTVEIIRVPEYHVYNHVGDEVGVARDIDELEHILLDVAIEDIK